ncbi:DUF1804 family protein [Thauera mechernichensis]|uniref:DUF1804 family protein n=1 Tax=Thauera mechernichensis TaxID=82788 RepID=A0ABW3WIY3_9RHOO|nr:DUF1804 family protein [Thauera mechernichensis]MDG3063267.1 DUF1804 family protein [Thauera mechernichensis]
MAHSDDTRRAVRASFVFDQLTLEASAALHQVPVPTARRWKGEARRAGDDWDKAQAAQLLAGGGIEEIARQTMAAFIQQVQATTTALQADTDLPPAERAKLLASLSDSFAKLMVSNRRLMPETDRLAVAMDVIQRFGEFIAKRRPALAGEFVEQLESFGDEIARAYG